MILVRNTSFVLSIFLFYDSSAKFLNERDKHSAKSKLAAVGVYFSYKCIYYKRFEIT